MSWGLLSAILSNLDPPQRVSISSSYRGQVGNVNDQVVCVLLLWEPSHGEDKPSYLDPPEVLGMQAQW